MRFRRAVHLGKRAIRGTRGGKPRHIIFYMIFGVIVIGATICLASKYQDVRKFLAGSFFMSSGILFYLWLTGTSLPLVGTSFVETPEISGTRSIVHFILLLATFYHGFFWRRKDTTK